MVHFRMSDCGLGVISKGKTTCFKEFIFILQKIIYIVNVNVLITDISLCLVIISNNVHFASACIYKALTIDYIYSIEKSTNLHGQSV